MRLLPPVNVNKWSATLRDVGLFGLVAIGITWPLALHLNRMVVGSVEWNGRPVYLEAHTHLWNIWWFRYSVFVLHQSPFDCRYVLYPVGANLWFHTLGPTLAIAAVFRQQFLTLTATYNVLMLGGLVTAALAAAAVAREFGLARAASNLAGAIYAFSPAVIAHFYAGHLELVWTCWMPVGLFTFLRLLHRPEQWVRWGLTLGAILACAAYSSAYYFVYTGELLFVAAAVHVRRFDNFRVWQALALTAVVVSLALAPLVRNFSQAGSTLADQADTLRSMRELSIDPVSLATPSFLHPWLAPAFQATLRRTNRGIAAPPETTGYIGATCVALIAIFAILSVRCESVRRRRYAWPLATAITVVFLVLSFGTELKFNGAYRGLTLPAAWLADVPMLRLARAPGRQIIVATLGIGILASMGWELLPTKWVRGLFLLPLAFEFLPAPMPLFPIRLPDVYRQIARTPGTYAVLDVPLSVRDGYRLFGTWDGVQMLGETVHGHPIVGAVVSRISDSRWRRVTSEPLIGSLLDPRVPVQGDAALSFFKEQRIRALVIHPDATPEQRQLISTSLYIQSRQRFPDGFELWWTQ